MYNPFILDMLVASSQCIPTIAHSLVGPKDGEGYSEDEDGVELPVECEGFDDDFCSPSIMYHRVSGSSSAWRVAGEIEQENVVLQTHYVDQRRLAVQSGALERKKSSSRNLGASSGALSNSQGRPPWKVRRHRVG